jgi:hypothetical protein
MYQQDERKRSPGPKTATESEERQSTDAFEGRGNFNSDGDQMTQWRSNKDKELHLICAGGADAFEALPIAIRNLGPWTGSKEGEVDRLRLPHRTMLTEQVFTIVYAHISKLNLEVPTGPPVLRGQADCPDCKGSGEVDQHGGLRKKTCWRCAGRGWIKAPVGR